MGLTLIISGVVLVVLTGAWLAFGDLAMAWVRLTFMGWAMLFLAHTLLRVRSERKPRRRFAVKYGGVIVEVPDRQKGEK